MGRWKKGPESSKGEHYDRGPVLVDLAAGEVCRAAVVDEEPAALHAKACKKSKHSRNKLWSNTVQGKFQSHSRNRFALENENR